MAGSCIFCTGTDTGYYLRNRDPVPDESMTEDLLQMRTDTPAAVNLFSYMERNLIEQEITGREKKNTYRIYER